MQTSLTYTTAALVAALSLLGPEAVAQQQVDTSGRALDANPQVGGGGSNRLEGQVDYRARNDIITGNVSGGAHFRDTIPYGAPGEFADDLGTENLFRFRANTLQSSPQQLNSVAPPVNLGGRSTVYRDFSTAPSLGTGSRVYRDPFRTGPSGAAYRYDDLRLDQEALYRNLAPNATRLGVTASEGRLLEVTASPLLGVRERDRGGDPLQSLLPERRVTPEADPEAVEPQDRELEDLSAQSRLEALRPYRPLLAPDPSDLQRSVRGDDQAQPWEEAGRINPTMMLGRQLQTRLGTPGEMAAATEQRLARMQDALLGRAEATADQREASPYARILGAVEEAGPQGERLPRGERDDGIELSDPAADQVEQAELARREAIRRAYGLDLPAQRDLEEDGDGTGDDVAQEQETLPPGALEQLLERLNYDLPPLETLADQDGSRTSELMQEAENALASGRYFDAEAIYRRVASRQGDEPMAQIGLVHAQLGAGMIRSAAFNLRNVLQEHPELMAARYGRNLLPDAQRLQWLRVELDRQIAEGGVGADAGLMMAYLGHQADSPQLVRYGLAVAEAREPRDPMWPVLRRIWLSPDAAPQDGRSE